MLEHRLHVDSISRRGFDSDASMLRRIGYPQWARIDSRWAAMPRQSQPTWRTAGRALCFPVARCRATDLDFMQAEPARMWWTILGPVVGLIAFTAALALVAWLVGWYPGETLGLGIGLGVAVAAFAAFLLLRQGRERQAVTAAL